MPIVDSTGSGKGDRNRVKNLVKYRDNYDLIFKNRQNKDKAREEADKLEFEKKQKEKKQKEKKEKEKK
jgi:hypothetical protein